MNIVTPTPRKPNTTRNVGIILVVVVLVIGIVYYSGLYARLTSYAQPSTQTIPAGHYAAVSFSVAVGVSPHGTFQPNTTAFVLLFDPGQYADY